MGWSSGFNDSEITSFIYRLREKVRFVTLVQASAQSCSISHLKYVWSLCSWELSEGSFQALLFSQAWFLMFCLSECVTSDASLWGLYLRLKPCESWPSAPRSCFEFFSVSGTWKFLSCFYPQLIFWLFYLLFSISMCFGVECILSMQSTILIGGFPLLKSWYFYSIYSYLLIFLNILLF